MDAENKDLKEKLAENRKKWKEVNSSYNRLEYILEEIEGLNWEEEFSIICKIKDREEKLKKLEEERRKIKEQKNDS